ncbi:L-lysine exporter family protein LysE/ArgO [Chromohalobacter marismortui]|uniref:L-lysine exporter family protein LysE/ArgO n=1 Tax=Chromohalobacter marismortui TaxID=42055 RepID=A0A4R7NIA6_9GAMM|nr:MULTISPECIES: LysE/ArgO family amino acid transporter [Chromohalobacter]MCI0511412.1 LysE/ArgO family amino acid transporter [Chromohalobacter sp.]MCI0594905.1 LysE/ArgO family amino acid transporter [Chromohalobacter sp.]TDU20353.1 L-lysine exporter family protein LysE/ArgO [Chromohalobacter marismortui]
MWGSWLNGLLVGAGLIIAIGAQNAFVLQRGLKNEYPWWVAAVCALCDLVLIGVGVLGLGALLATHTGLMQVARWAGVAFLSWQAWQAWQRVRHPVALQAGGEASPRLWRVLMTTLAVTLLNPHVYLDTLIMLGAIGAQQAVPLAFVVGASMASLAWFFGLVGGAAWLAPRLADPRYWQAIEGAICAVLLLVAWQLATTPLGAA